MDWLEIASKIADDLYEAQEGRKIHEYTMYYWDTDSVSSKNSATAFLATLLEKYFTKNLTPSDLSNGEEEEIW